MKNRKSGNGNKGMGVKPLALLLALALLLGGVMGGTLAWLTDKTDTVTNTFTVGDINIDLTEQVSNQFHFVPGDTQEKDPKVTVEANSEACFLFVKVTVANNANGNVASIVNFDVADGWKYVVNGVEKTAHPAAYVNGTYYFYRQVDADTAKAGTSYFVLAGNDEYREGIITIDEHVTKDMVGTINANKPTVTFNAAAIQVANIETLAKAWSELPATFKA